MGQRFMTPAQAEQWPLLLLVIGLTHHPLTEGTGPNFLAVPSLPIR